MTVLEKTVGREVVRLELNLVGFFIEFKVENAVGTPVLLFVVPSG
jgi:hypothetical protein